MRRLSASLALLAALFLPFPASPDRYTPVKLLHDRATLRAADEMRSVDVLLCLVPFALLLAAGVSRHPKLATAHVVGSAWVLFASAWLLLPDRLTTWSPLAALSLLILSGIDGLARLRRPDADPERRWRILLPLTSASLELVFIGLVCRSIPSGVWTAEDVLWSVVYPLGWAATHAVVAWGAWAGARWTSWLGAAVHAALAAGGVWTLARGMPLAVETKGHSLMGVLDVVLPQLALDAAAAVLFARQAWKSRVKSETTALTEA